VSKKPTIRIVKRDERLRIAEAPDPSQPTDPPEQDPIDQARTVTGWIREFKKKGNPRAERVFNSLFTAHRPSEA
jgi:hypothetical protein